MANLNCNAVDSVKNHITEKMLSAVLQDLKVCSGFFDFETLYKRVSEYIFSMYDLEPSDFFGSSHIPDSFRDFDKHVDIFKQPIDF